MRIRLLSDVPGGEAGGARKGREFEVTRQKNMRTFILGDDGVELWLVDREFEVLEPTLFADAG